MPNTIASHATARSHTVEAPVSIYVRESATTQNAVVIGVDHPVEGRKRLATVSLRNNGDVAVRTLADQELSRFSFADLDDDDN